MELQEPSECPRHEDWRSQMISFLSTDLRKYLDGSSLLGLTQEVLQGVPADRLEECRNEIRSIVPVLLEEGQQYQAQHISLLAETNGDVILKYVGDRYKREGVIDEAFADFVLNHSPDVDLLDEAARIRFKMYEPVDVIGYNSLVGRSNKLRDLANRYAHIHSYPSIDAFHLSHANAAVELLNDEYDAVIGIARSGSTVPVLMDALDANVGIIRTAREWKRSPVWHTRCELRNGMRILLCDDDVVSGGTVSSVIQKIRRECTGLDVHVCLTGCKVVNSIHALENIEGVDDILPMGMLATSNIISNIDLVNGKLESRIEESDRDRADTKRAS